MYVKFIRRYRSGASCMVDSGGVWQKQNLIF